MTIRGILFDKDGTLIDFQSTYGIATKAVIADLANGDHQLMQNMADAVDFDLQNNIIAPSSPLVAGTAVDQVAVWKEMLDCKDPQAMEAKIDLLFEKYSAASVVPFDDLESSLKNLKQMGIVMGIATNDSQFGAESHANQLGIQDYFDFIAGHNSGYGAKPGPGMVLAFGEKQEIPTNQIMMVGDSLHDLAAGNNAEAISVGITTGLADGDELSPFSDHVVESLSELVELVKALN